ncbi:MAG TPA: sigma-54 dependent transcriptional regulator [Longimicrobiales bacterium]|nr:sigma-54 dependent transcriptional regulator [Longimicrobiales bacterium]
MNVLIIDDEPGLRQTVSMILGEEGYDVTVASDGEEGLRKALDIRPDLILCDVRMPRLPGLEFVERYRAEGGEALVIVMTAYGSTQLAVDAMKLGAYDYLPKPFSADQLVLTLKKAEERESLRREVRRLRGEVTVGRRYGEIIAKSPAMSKALETATKVARYPSPVLVSGESGTGKELVARLIHEESDRSGASFVAVNCGAIPENLLESELFGHVKGAFTGADRERTGLFEEASGGTLFLDEIGEMPPSLQVKLLRVLQEGEVRRLGENRDRKVDVRIIAATNKDIDEEVRDDNFRRDLYYRIAVVPIHLAPLRQRREEIPLMAAHFVATYNERLRLSVRGVEPEAMKLLLEYHWPGNVRELENTIERAMVLTDRDRIAVDDLPGHVRVPIAPLDQGDLGDDELSVKKHTASLEKRLIQKAIARTGGNKTRAAELLDLSARALLYKMRDYGLEKDSGSSVEPPA